MKTASIHSWHGIRIVWDRLREWILGQPIHAQGKREYPAGDAENDPFFGHMKEPTASAGIRGPCGDAMEFYLRIRDEVIEDVRYQTDGCGNTRSCGYAVAYLVRGRGVTDALSISAGELIRSGACEPEAGRHCAILAVSTFYRAVADYLLKRQDPDRNF